MVSFLPPEVPKGVYLSDKDRLRTLMGIVKVIDGEKRIKSCVLGIQDCNLDNPCVLHKLVGANKAKFFKVLERTTILDVIEEKQDIEKFFLV